MMKNRRRLLGLPGSCSVGAPHTSSCQPWTTSLLSLLSVLPLFPLHSVLLLSLCFLFLPMNWFLSLSQSLPPSPLYIIFSYLFPPPLTSLLPSFDAWFMEEKRRSWMKPCMATESSIKSSAKLSTHFISLPFLLLSFPFSIILVILEIEAKATGMLDKYPQITAILFLRWSLGI